MYFVDYFTSVTWYLLGGSSTNKHLAYATDKINDDLPVYNVTSLA